jgi:hypothetical protein
METTHNEHRLGILLVILALLVVVGFRMFSPHRIGLFTSKHERDLRSRLEGIKPPAGVRLARINVHHDRGDVWEGTVIHMAQLGLGDKKSYYIAEFARNGFVYRADEARKASVYRFCSPDCGAELIPLTMRSEEPSGTDGLSSLYLISMTWKDPKC